MKWMSSLLMFGVSGAVSLALVSALTAADGKDLLKLYDFDQYSRQPISFYYCQAGFPSDGYKPIYVWTRDRFSEGTAVLRNCTTGKTVSVPLTSHGVNLWGRQDWIADCTGIATEGDYTLRAVFGGQSAETAPFAISKNCYAELQEKAAKHYFLKRCGIFCHTHDGNLYSLDPDSFGKVLGHVPAYGGWHDAHNDDKWMWLAWSSVYGLLKTQERFSPQWHGSNEPYPYCLAEAWWEVDWLLRMQKSDGTFYYAVTEWFPQLAQAGRSDDPANPPRGQPNLRRPAPRPGAVLDVWGKGEVGRLMGETTHCYASTAPKYFAYCAHILRYCGRLMRPYDKKNAERCSAAAGKTVAYLENLKEYPPYQELEVHAALALYWLEEAKDGGGPAARVKAEGYLNKVLARQQPEGHFHSSQTCQGLEFHPEDAGDERVFVDYPFGYMLAFHEYLEYAKEEKGKSCVLIDQVKTAYLRFAHMLETFCNATVFRQPGEIRFDRKPAVILPLDIVQHGYNPYILSAGVVFAAAERLAGYRGGLELGQRQLQWVFGANPRFMSYMNQVGVRNSGQYAASSSITHQYYPMAFYRHLRDMRWGVPVGIFGPLEKKLDTDWRKASSLPNYPDAGASVDGTYDSSAQETWINCNGWLLLLLAQLER